jgi:hypothetical protein
MGLYFDSDSNPFSLCLICENFPNTFLDHPTVHVLLMQEMKAEVEATNDVRKHTKSRGGMSNTPAGIA